nr:uncharacterized protein LOC104088425 [Nicotiana tomentosiformis]
MDMGIKRNRKKRAVCSQPRIKWENLTKDKAQELGERLLAMGAWKSSGDTIAMWSMTTNYIREAAREVLRVTKGYTGRHIGDWWWNVEVQGKVEVKKTAYLKLVESTSEEEKRTNWECYKKAKKEAKLTVTAANYCLWMHVCRTWEQRRGQEVVQGSALSPFLFALAMDMLTRHIQGEVPWCTIFADNIVLMDETRGGVNARLEV